MYAYIVATTGLIEPFGEHPRDCLIGGRRLEQAQDDALQALGIHPVRVSDVASINDPAPHLIIEDRLYFSRELVAEFLARARAR